MPSTEDERQETDWIRRAQRGDASAFGPLVEKYQARVFSIIFRLVRNRDDVEDLAQEIFVKAFTGLGSYNFRSPFAAWLSRVAVNHCYDYLRHERASRVTFYSQLTEESQRVLEERSADLEESGSRVETRLAFRDLVNKLLQRASIEDRTILILKEVGELSVEEIGNVLGLRVSTVKVRLHRARKRLVRDFRKWKQRGEP